MGGAGSGRKKGGAWAPRVGDLGPPPSRRPKRPTEAARDAVVAPAEAAEGGVDQATLLAVARENLAVYAKMFLTGPNKPPYFGKFAVARHHKEWADLVNKHNRLLILASRNSGKSFFFSLAYLIWQADRLGEDHVGALFGGSDDLANLNLSLIRTEVETNDRLRHLRPKKGYEWSATKLRFGNGFLLHARGMGRESRGIHPDVIVADDICPNDTLLSEQIRTKTIEYFNGTVSPMLNPGGQVVIIGTPFVQGDLYTVLERDPTCTRVAYPAINADGSLLWPERLSLEMLNAARARGEIIFSREYLCRPVSDASSLFPTEFFHRPGVQDISLEFGQTRQYYAEKAGVSQVFSGVDFAFSNEAGSDFTVITTVGLDADQNVWLLDMQRVKGLPFEAQKQLIIEVAARMRPDKIFTESNGAQRIFGDTLKVETQLPIEQYQTGSEKHTLDRGLPSLRVLFENTKVRVPARGGLHPNVQIWIDEMHGFATVNGRVVGTTEHDDTGMSFFLACLAMRAVGQFRFAFGDAPLSTGVRAPRSVSELAVVGTPTKANPLGVSGPSFSIQASIAQAEASGTKGARVLVTDSRGRPLDQRVASQLQKRDGAGIFGSEDLLGLMF